MVMRELLPLLPKPSRFAGIEEGAIIKDRAHVDLHVALAFPDTYEVGMSYIGQKILYDIINKRPEWWAERVFLPEKEAAEILRQAHAPLASLESDTSLAQMDALCFSVTHELCYTDLLHMLDLAGIPLRSCQRGNSLYDYPIIMAGGGALPGAEALMPFVDLAALGDGEEMICEILESLQKARQKGWTRQEFLHDAARLPGVYIPCLFPADERGIVHVPRDMAKPARRVMPDLDHAPFPVRQTLPLDAIHDRLVLEIARGCTRGCRFCHAGFVYRPLRERSPQQVEELLEQALAGTGYDEVSFLSLSAGDYSALTGLFDASYRRCAKEQISLALPSLRVGSVGAPVLAQMAKIRRTGITLAPEAGSQRLRDVINKGVTENELLEHIAMLLEFGWRHVKLYFMIGLPTETDEDLEAIVHLCDRVHEMAKKTGRNIQVSAALSTFVPKPFTPFQWEAQPSLAEIERRIRHVLDYASGRRYLKIRWHDPKVSHLEGILSRADRRMADVVEKAYRKGAIYTGWAEHFRLDPWLDAMEECGLDAEEFTAARAMGSTLPWSHIEIGINEAFLATEREKAYKAATTPDCRCGLCEMCGACDRGTHKSKLARSVAFTGKIQTMLAEKPNPKKAEADLETWQSKNTDMEQTRPPQIAENLREKKACWRFWHIKQGGYVWLSQLELQDQLLRALRRAGIPLAFSGGFRPAPLLSFTRALPVGLSSGAEWFSVILRADMPQDELLDRLKAKLPAGLGIFQLDECAQKARTMQSVSEQFSIAFEDRADLQKMTARLADLSGSADSFYTYSTKKGEKTVNLTSFIRAWKLMNDGEIALHLDWQTGYLSPLVLTGALLCETGGRQTFRQSFTLRKHAQILGGRLYGNQIF